MKSPPHQIIIASDASAKGSIAAYGGVLHFPDGSLIEVSGPVPRSEFQEVTAALTTLRHLQGTAPATLQVDAQEDLLRAVLCVTHPHVMVTRIPRNSSDLHQRAHDLARAALSGLYVPSEKPSGGPRVAVYAQQSLDQPATGFAVAFYDGEAVTTRTGSVPAQPTKALTQNMIRQQLAGLIPDGFELVEAKYATGRNNHPEWNATGGTLTDLRRQSTKALNSIDTAP